MKIKKLLAGVVAAALTVTSLAVVNVSAAEDKTTTYSFIHKANDLTFTYSKTISARAGANLNEFIHVEETDQVDGVTGKKIFKFGLKPGGAWANNYEPVSDAAIKSGMANPAYDGAGSIEVVGIDANKKNATVKTDFKIADDGQLMFYGVIDTKTDHLLGKNELDLGRIVDITKITVTQKFVKKNINFVVPTDYTVGYYGFGADYVAGNECSDAGFKKFLDQEVASDSDESYWPFTNKQYDIGGAEIAFDTVYSLENNYGEFTGDNHAILDSHSKITFLQWVNDTIGYNKGAKIRFTFAEGSKDTQGSLTIFGSAGVDGQRPWFTEGGASESHKANDMVLAVNTHSSNKLRQEVVMSKVGNNYVAEFDWDTVMAASPTTTTAHVTSISFALNNGHLGNGSTTVPGDNIPEIKLKDKLAARLIQIDIIVPGNQPANLPGNTTSWDNTVTKVEDPNSGVIAEGTNAAITGNGAAYIKVVGKLTTNSLTYDVKFVNKDGEYVQPAGDITLTLPLPKEIWDRTVNKVTHHKGDGTSEQLDIINKDTYKTDHFVKVVTSSFSGFEIELEPEATEPEETKAPETQAPETQAPTTTAAAGDTNQGGNDKNTPATGFAIAIVPAAIAAAAAVVAKKRK